MKQNWIKEFDKKFLEYDGKWIAKDKYGNCKTFTEKDIKDFIQSQLNKRDDEWKKREKNSVLLAFNIADYPEAKAKKETELIINS